MRCAQFSEGTSLVANKENDNTHALLCCRKRTFPNRPVSAEKREKPTENFQPANQALGGIFSYVINSSCFSYPNSNYIKNCILLSKSYFQILRKITSNKSARHVESQ